MWKELDHEGRVVGPLQRSPTESRAAESSRRSREQVMMDIKLELATGSLQLLDARTRGSDPYNSRLGASGRDPWGTRRRG